MSAERPLLRLAVSGVAVLFLIAPIALGLAETARAAFGLVPALGFERPSLEPWRELLAMPGFATSLRLTLLTGVGSTLLALLMAVAILAAMQPSGLHRVSRMLPPFLAIPHAAMAVGLAFVLAPSGWIARGIAPLADWVTPPALSTVNDPNGLALMLGLVVKELPFLLLVMLAGMGRIEVARQVAMGRSLGYVRGMAFVKLILPQLWPLIRLPVWAVLAYALSVVDMALILGPSNPPVLAVAVTRWFTDPDVAMILPASAGALLQVLVVGFGIAMFWLAERALARIGRWWLRHGGRGSAAAPGLRIGGATVFGLFALSGLAMLSLLLWSLAWRWPWPALLPESWSFSAWTRGSGWPRALGHTVLLASASVVLSLALAIAWLEAEGRSRKRSRWTEALIYLPLILPQIGFLYGLNTAFLRAGLAGGWAAVIWAQALFVFPYVMIALSGPWRALEPGLLRSAAALGAGPWRRFLAVKLPVLLRPVLTAAAIGVAVSVAQYLPTLFMGAGRIPTLTTEAVTLSSGSDRRVTGVYATLQAALPFAAYLAAVLIPALAHRNRRGLQGGGT